MPGVVFDRQTCPRQNVHATEPVNTYFRFQKHFHKMLPNLGHAFKC